MSKRYRFGTDKPADYGNAWSGVEYAARTTTKSCEELERLNRPRRNPVRSGVVVRTATGRKFEARSTVVSTNVCYNADASVRKVVVRRKKVNENVVAWSPENNK